MQDRLAAGERPDEFGKILARLGHRQLGPGAADRGFDLGPRADDARIGQQPLNIFGARTGPPAGGQSL